jgi:transcriptional regulator with XRE-family HTH domain
MCKRKETKAKRNRLRLGWSQQELAVFAGVSVADVSRIETGRLRPYPGQAQKLAHVLGLRAEELQNEVLFEEASSELESEETP